MIQGKPRLSLDTIDLFQNCQKSGNFSVITREQLIALALFYQFEENVDLVTNMYEEDPAIPLA
jgi:hypothetical protein